LLQAIKSTANTSLTSLVEFKIFCYKLIEAKPRQHTIRLLQDID